MNIKNCKDTIVWEGIMRETSLLDRVSRCAVTRRGRDGITGLYWCLAGLDGICAWSAGPEAEAALKYIRKLAE